ncbi:helix-turn-helix domain-containing protein [Bacillus sp. FSL R12-0069]|uniref:helix-turn-helix domain-containing protein n=1 Tax=Bacillus sp. FSL R12-0069 TaxID=2975342 RepID=UPI0030F5931A
MRFKIKEIRNKAGDTLQNSAEKINYDYSNLSKFERGVYTPSLNLLHKIATVYNMEIPQNYTFTLSNEEISKEELLFLIQTLNILRQTIKVELRKQMDET